MINVAVTDFREQTMEIRILGAASDAGRTFDHRCEMREKIIAFDQREYPHALPRLRADIADGSSLRESREKEERPRLDG